jgi:chaperonin GroEL
VAVKLPGFGQGRSATLADVAVLTGAQVVSTETGISLASATLDLLGRARRVIITSDSTMIVDGAAVPADVAARVAQLQHEIDNAASSFDRDRTQGRLARLTGGVAVIHVGAATEVELTERKRRIEDAIGATRAALAEGTVAGGGTSLIRARRAVHEIMTSRSDADEVTGARIVWHALAAPARQIAANAGYDPGVVVEHIERELDAIGFNALTDTYEDLAKAGVIDAAMVVKAALTNAASVAALVLTTECIITGSR